MTRSGRSTPTDEPLPEERPRGRRGSRRSRHRRTVGPRARRCRPASTRPRALPSAQPRPLSPSPMPSWTPRPTLDEVGVVGWLKARFNEPPVRPDRSATLRHEGGGRLDRLDLFLVVLLILGTMFLRTFRLAEPYQMHFDEVYHARTATEFLQVLALRHLARHLRVDPPARRQVPDGRRSRGVRQRQGQCHERPRGPGRGRRRRTAPAGRDRSRRSGWRATARRHWHRDPDLRPPDPRPGLDRAGRGRHGPGDRRDRQPARHRLRRRTDRHARPRPDRWRRLATAARPPRSTWSPSTTRSTTSWS